MRPYGFTAGREGLVEEEAGQVRRAASMVEDGDKLGRVAEEATGGRLSASTLRKILLNPRTAGLRDDLTPGPWPAILDRQVYLRVRAVLIDPDRSTGNRPDARVYLLTGGFAGALAFCGLCAAPLIASPISGRRCYACASRRRSGGCGKIRVAAAYLDLYVSEKVHDWILADLATEGRLTERRERLDREARAAQDRADAAKAAVNELIPSYTAGVVSKDVFVQVVADAQGHEDHAKKLRRIAAVELPATENELTTWRETASVEQVREVVEVYLERVEVHPVIKRGSHQFDPDRVSIQRR